MKYHLGRSITKLFRYYNFGVDKSAAEGKVVTLKGDTFEVCGKRGKMDGLYTAGSSRRVLTLEGDRVTVTIPEGIIYYGNAMAKKVENEC